MKIRIGAKGEMREVRIEGMLRKDGTVYIGGFMGYGLAERVGIEIDADTLAEIVRAAVKGGGYLGPKDDPDA